MSMLATRRQFIRAFQDCVYRKALYGAVAESAEGFAEADGATALAVRRVDSQSGSDEDSAAALHTTPDTVKVELA